VTFLITLKRYFSVTRMMVSGIVGPASTLRT
jgi:hypothetical protein